MILSTTTDRTVLASIKVDGGYAFGSTQHDFVKSTGPGSIQYATGQLLSDRVHQHAERHGAQPGAAKPATTTKQPVFYLSNGMIFGNQAFTFQRNTFIQGNRTAPRLRCSA